MELNVNSDDFFLIRFKSLADAAEEIRIEPAKVEVKGTSATSRKQSQPAHHNKGK